MAAERPVVFVIDDDPSMRHAVEDLIASVGLEPRVFATPQEFLHAKRADAPSCLVLDVRLPGASGLAFQEELTNAGIERDRVQRQAAVATAGLRQRFATLTEREREIMALVIAGHANKRIAARLGVAEGTVKVHRGQIMRKMLAPSVQELVRMGDMLGKPKS